MADYTTQLRTICEFYAGEDESQGYNKIDEIVEKSAPNIFENFPIFSEDYRLILEKKILRHFYTREICMETVGLWKLHFNNKMNEIMPYYNKLYESELLKFNPFYDVDLTRENNRDSNSESNSKTKNDTTVDNSVNKSGTSTDENKHTMYGDRNLGEDNKRTEDMKNTTITNQTTTREPKNLTTEYKPENYQTHELNKFLDTPQGGVTLSGGNLSSNYLTDVRDITKTENGSTKTIQSGKEDTTVSGGNTETTTGDIINKRNLNDVNYEENSRFNKHKDDTSETGYSDTKSTTDTNAKTNNMESFFEKIRGKQGTKSYSKLLEEFRATFLNIDMLIINELEPLFFGLW